MKRSAFLMTAAFLAAAVLPVAAHAATPANAAAKPGAAAKPPAAPRTLEDIRIEGEIPVPQVLFITARDQRRFMDLHHHRYLRTSLQIGERIAYPAALAVVQTPATGTAKEQSP